MIGVLVVVFGCVGGGLSLGRPSVVCKLVSSGGRVKRDARRVERRSVEVGGP